MKSTSIALSALRAQRVDPLLAMKVAGAGEVALLEESLLGLIASREYPGRVLLETLDRVSEWVKAGRIIVSGFHSPLEQQVLRSLLRRNGRAVKVLARGFSTEGADYRPTPEEREATVLIRERFAAVRQAVLRRAKDICELCGERGFVTASGSIYLETHHVVSLADDGPDYEVNVVAGCLQDHWRAHFAAERDEIRVRLRTLLAAAGA